MNLTTEQLAACEQYDAFVARIAAEIKAIAASRGFVCDGEDERAGSRYMGIWTVEDDGCRDERVAAVRISNHRQAHGGPDWSFEVSDSEESISRGFAEIRRIVETY